MHKFSKLKKIGGKGGGGGGEGILYKLYDVSSVLFELHSPIVLNCAYKTMYRVSPWILLIVLSI
jgi:hypothetical protein